jgi:predicted signal transduction protein with EAL and GGDEF domain
VQTNVSCAEEAQLFADRIIAAVTAPFEIERHHASISASIGITLAPRDAVTAEQLLKNADLAMYRAKREGRGRWRFFAAEMQTMARASVLLEIDLRQSVERGEFMMCYQPQVDVRTRRVVGAEALLRWRRPGHGLVMPGDFLALAEDTGLIAPINRWVVQEVCRQAAAWAAAGTPIQVGINISSAVFRTENIRELVLGTLASSGLDPALLELELTESTLLDNQREVADDLHALRALGIRVAIDDFGTGYSSLAYLRQFPVDVLKIDKSFIAEMDGSPNSSALIHTLVELGRTLGLVTLAEGIEDHTQLEALRDEYCDRGQGFILSRPVSSEEIERLLSESASERELNSIARARS